MMLYDLTITPISDGGSGGSKAFRLRAKAFGDSPTLSSGILSVDEYRAVMSKTNLQSKQIEHPVLTGEQTTFGSGEGGTTTFSHDQLLGMGMRPEA